MPHYDENDKVPTIRSDFRRLLAVNPNYFGNLPKSKLKPIEIISNNTSYEALTCIGINLAFNQLEATIAVKLPTGYGGSLCTQGSLEYVRFYISYDGDGSTFVDLGLGAVSTHDIPNATDCNKKTEKPLYYTVTLPFTPEVYPCFFANLPLVRGILSWNVPPPPNEPNWAPVWGNHLDQNVQIRPGPWKIIDIVNFIPKDIIPKLPPSILENPNIPIPIPDPPPIELETLAATYGKAVPPHRFGLPSLQKALTSTLDQQELLEYQNTWSNVNLNFGDAIKNLQETSGSTEYEQLECLGLDYGRGSLVATFNVKLSSGYSGGTCSAGSYEYVTFWADWDDTCTWSYLGTINVNVHDISSIPKDGLSYSAVLPVDVNSLAVSCETPKVSRVRAVLSWSTPSSATDPNALPTWGNIVDSYVQIPPGSPIDGATIISIGGISVNQIDTGFTGLTQPVAQFVFQQVYADSRQCPFGGEIVIQGFGPTNLKYRLWAQLPPTPAGGISIPPMIVTSPIDVLVIGQIGLVHHVPDNGFLPFLPFYDNFEGILSNWTPSIDGKWQIGLEVATAADVDTAPIQWLNILVKNSAPTCEVNLTSASDCGDITVGSIIKGAYTATDPYFGSFSLGIIPNPHGNQISPSSGTSPTTGGTWSLDTGSPGSGVPRMDPCGYAVILQAWDRSILGSAPGSGNGASDSKGFCLRSDSSTWDKCEMEE
jgi:hypothetical protein